MAIDPEQRIARLSSELMNLEHLGLELLSAAYIVTSKKETSRFPLPRQEDFELAASLKPLEGEDAWNLSWANILRRLRPILLQWWIAWDLVNIALKELPREVDTVLSEAFRNHWRPKLSKLLMNLGNGICETRPEGDNWKGEIDLFSFVRHRLPATWREYLEQIADYVSDLHALQNSGFTEPLSAEPSNKINLEASSLTSQITELIKTARSEGSKKSSTDGKKTSGRPSKSESDSTTKVLAGLTQLHGYENGAVSDAEPRSVAEVAIASGTSKASVSRALCEIFGVEKDGYKAYGIACREKRLGIILAAKMGDISGYKKYSS